MVTPSESEGSSAGPPGRAGRASSASARAEARDHPPARVDEAQLEHLVRHAAEQLEGPHRAVPVTVQHRVGDRLGDRDEHLLAPTAVQIARQQAADDVPRDAGRLGLRRQDEAHVGLRAAGHARSGAPIRRWIPTDSFI